MGIDAFIIMSTFIPNELVIFTPTFKYKVRLNEINICIIQLNDNLEEDLDDVWLNAVYIPIEDWPAIRDFISNSLI